MLKAALLVLLAGNTVYFAVFGTASKAIDSAAWLTLLVLFQAEVIFAERLAGTRSRVILRAMRLIAAVGVCAATAGYVFEDNPLDAINSVLWILLVILLEAQLRWSSVAAGSVRAFRGAAYAIFAGLAVLVILWAVAGMWIDAYDAVLWLVAYGALEAEIRRHDTPAAPCSA